MIFRFLQKVTSGGIRMKEKEKQPIPWEAKDPKPPIVHSGHMENRKAN
jgi:hypothetical protein